MEPEDKVIERFEEILENKNPKLSNTIKLDACSNPFIDKLDAILSLILVSVGLLFLNELRFSCILIIKHRR